MTFKQRPEGGKKTSSKMQRGREEGVFSASLKIGVSVARKGKLGEIGETQGQDAEHGDLHVLAKEEAIGSGRQGHTLLSLNFQSMSPARRASLLDELERQARKRQPSKRQWGLSQDEGVVTNDKIWGVL